MKTTKTINEKQFLDSIFGDDPHVIVGKPKPTGGWTADRRDDKSYRRWAQGKRAEAWHFCISTIRPTPEHGYQRRKIVDAEAVYCIVLDDVGTKVDKDLITLPPSWILESSPGNFQYGYILDEPCTDLERVEAVLGGLIAAKMSDPGASDVVHFFRVPGSANLKKGNDLFRSRVTEWHPERRYSLTDVQMGTTPGRARKRARTAIDVAADVDVVDDLMTFLSENDLVLEDKGEAVIITCPWAENHTTGSDEAAYFPLGRGEGDMPMRRGFKCLHGNDQCKDKTFKDFLKHLRDNHDDVPVVGGYDPLPWLQHRYALVAGAGTAPVFVDALARGGPIWKYSPGAVSVLPGWYGTMVSPNSGNQIGIPTAFRQHPDTKRYNEFGYEPGGGMDIRVDGGMLCNEWVPVTHPETDTVPEHFLAHVEHLVPDAGERDVFLDWLAHKLQNPSKRSYAVLMVTDEIQGVGRGILGDVLCAVWGDQARADIELADLLGVGYQASNYNDWMSGTQFVIVEEAMEGLSKDDRYKGYTTLKQRIDARPTQVLIKRKGLAARKEMIWFNCLIYSNHLDALVLPAEDRRFMVIRNTDTKISEDDGDRIAANIMTETAAVFWFLKRRDVSHFKSAKAPKTDAWFAMAEMNASPRDRVFVWLLDNIPGDIITKPDFTSWYDRACDAEDVDPKTQNVWLGWMWRRLQHLLSPSERPKGTQVRIRTTPELVRVVRNTDKWRSLYKSGEVELVRKEALLNDPNSYRKNPFKPVT